MYTSPDIPILAQLRWTVNQNMQYSGQLSETLGRQGFDVHQSPLYARFHAETEEIARLKWCESERVGHDIGMDRAMWLWMMGHRKGWLNAMRASGVEGF